MKAPHAARPLVVPGARRGFGAPITDIYVKPFVCSVCDRPIEHRGGGAWRHTPTTERNPS